LNYLSQVDACRSTAQECLELHRAFGNQIIEIDILLIFAGEISDKAQRTRLFQRALQLAQTHGDTWQKARMLHQLGWNYSGGERISYWVRAITLFRQAGDWRSLADLLSTTGNFAILNGDLQLAQTCLDEAALLNNQLKDKLVQANTLYLRARLAMMRGDYNQAHIYSQEQLGITEELGARMSSLWCRSHMGYLALYEGNLTEARDILEETVQEFQKDGNEGGIVFTLEGIAGLSVAVNKPESAARLIGWADAMREKINDPRPKLEQVDVDKIIAACLAKMGEAAFSGAYNVGRKMTMDEAVALAINEG
jgi:tetratricopeptide (TPR) repeat protein